MSSTTTKFMQGFSGAEQHNPVIIKGLVGGAANTRKDIAHGLGYTPKVAIPVLEGTDDNSAENPVGAVMEIVKIDDTNVTVKCATGSMPFSLVIFP